LPSKDEYAANAPSGLAGLRLLALQPVVATLPPTVQRVSHPSTGPLVSLETQLERVPVSKLPLANISVASAGAGAANAIIIAAAEQLANNAPRLRELATTVNFVWLIIALLRMQGDARVQRASDGSPSLR
jgi:hypothetical protein